MAGNLYVTKSEYLSNSKELWERILFLLEMYIRNRINIYKFAFPQLDS